MSLKLADSHTEAKKATVGLEQGGPRYNLEHVIPTRSVWFRPLPEKHDERPFLCVCVVFCLFVVGGVFFFVCVCVCVCVCLVFFFFGWFFVVCVCVFFVCFSFFFFFTLLFLFFFFFFIYLMLL